MDLLLYLALIPALGVAAQWLAWRSGLPSILLLLTFGIVLGRFVSPDEILKSLLGTTDDVGSRLLLPIVSLAVAVILLEGGLSLKIRELENTGGALLRLCTIGAAVTMVLTALAAHFLLDFRSRTSLLLGGIFTVTGPTVIGPLLRQIRPNKRVTAILKWEGIVVDPIGAILAVLVFEELLSTTKEVSFVGVVGMLLHTTLAGLLIGSLSAVLLIELLRRYWLPDYLHGIATLAVALLGFAISNHLAHESGLVTVTVLGIMMANQKACPIEHIIEFKEHLRTLLIGCLFILLGSRINPHDVTQLGWGGIAFVATMILIVRPLSVLAATIGTPLPWAERIFVACMAPRGIVAAAVTSVFALRLATMNAGKYDADVDRLVPTTFAMILGTVSVYGLGSGWVANRLGLAKPQPQGILIAGADQWVRDLASLLQSLNVPVVLVDTNFNKVAAAKMAGLTAYCANVLSEHGIDELDLSHVGRFLACTPNDEVNSLAMRMMRGTFGSENLYQLPTRNKHSRAIRTSMAPHLKGRTLFNNNLTHSTIAQAVKDGATFKVTSITASFTFADFRAKYSSRAVVLMTISETDIVRFNTIDKRLEPVAGQRVVALISSEPIPQGDSGELATG